MSEAQGFKPDELSTLEETGGVFRLRLIALVAVRPERSVLRPFLLTALAVKGLAHCRRVFRNGTLWASG